MSKVMEERLKETDLRATLREKINFAVRLLKRGKDTLEEISALSGLSIDDVQELAADLNNTPAQA